MRIISSKEAPLGHGMLFGFGMNTVERRWPIKSSQSAGATDGISSNGLIGNTPPRFSLCEHDGGDGGLEINRNQDSHENGVGNLISINILKEPHDAVKNHDP